VGLEELERLRSELLATVGHELRTPLTAIRTSIGLLLDPGLEPSDDQRQQLLGTIGRSADRMQRLLTELLDLARLRSGRVEMTWASLDARDVAREVEAAVGPMAATRDQRLVVELPDAPITVWGDRGRLEQALLNLVANAQKFSPEGADVLLRVSADPDGRVRWSVVDSGPGIAPNEQERLFERFFVGASDRHVAGGGTGIGLPTALAIAQAHGGAIEVDSEVGRGSAFHLVIEPGGTVT
jgi:signal transduction histidine kinase